MAVTEALLEFYAQPAAMTSPGRQAALLDDLADDPRALAEVVQGLVVHEYAAAPFYGFEIPEERKAESHLRPVESLLRRIVELDDRPLAHARPVERRLVGVCRHFAVLLVALLRASGVPARARCGFGAYFIPGSFEDHWVAEVWRAGESRWVLVDAQLDATWRRAIGFAEDRMDVPRDRFLVGADAWQRCRAGAADPATFGITHGNLHGLWFVAGDVIRDALALAKVEMLAWDVWGAMIGPDESIADDAIAFVDRLAELTHEPDAHHDELRRLCAGDARLRVPATVFNAVRDRPEPV